MKQDIVIIGVGETAELASDYFSHDSDYMVRCFAAEKKYLERHPGINEIDGCPVVSVEELPKLFPVQWNSAFVAMGYGRLNHDRARMYHMVKSMGYKMVSYVSSHAFVGRNVHIGDNCFVLEHNVLQRNVRLGNDVVLWSGNHIGHRSVIEDHVFLSSHVAVSGYCRIGRYSFLGINTCLGDGISVAENCFVGGGVAVMKDTDAGRIYRSVSLEPEKISCRIVFDF